MAVPMAIGKKIHKKDSGKNCLKCVNKLWNSTQQHIVAMH